MVDVSLAARRLLLQVLPCSRTSPLEPYTPRCIAPQTGLPAELSTSLRGHPSLALPWPCLFSRMANLIVAFAAIWILTLAGGLVVAGGLGALTAVRGLGGGRSARRAPSSPSRALRPAMPMGCCPHSPAPHKPGMVLACRTLASPRSSAPTGWRGQLGEPSAPRAVRHFPLAQPASY